MINKMLFYAIYHTP